ncbi:hypothetical protein ACEV6Q_04085 [Enterobacter ludwigii]|uniref:hypothetical protein n=1 Tax=Enterobacter ludwigii TaxID=299767 RepID=UPI003BEF0774
MCENNNPLGNIVSRAACIRNLNGKNVVRTVGGEKTIEDIPEMDKQIRRFVKDRFGDEAVVGETETIWTYGSNFWRKPKMYRVTEGEIHFRSKDYYFIDNGNKIYGDLKDDSDELVGQTTEWREGGFIRIFKHPLGDRQYVYQLL